MNIDIEKKQLILEFDFAGKILAEEEEEEEEEAIVVSIKDITDRKKAEEDLKESEEKYRDLVNFSTDIIYKVDKSGKNIFLNSAVKRILGYEPEEMIGKSAFDFMFPENIAPTQEAHNRVIEEGKNFWDYETRYINKNGSIITIAWNVFTLRDKNGNIIGTQGMGRDITKRKRAEEALRQSELSLAKAQQIAHLGNWDWNVQGQTLTWSDEVYRIFGVEKEFELTYEGVEAMVHPDDREKNQEFMNQILTTSDPSEIEIRIIRPDGTVRQVYQNAETERDESGNVCRIFGIMQDITERKKVEHELQERIKEITCLYKVNRDMHEDLSIDELCHRIVEHMVQAMQFPEITVPVIELNGERFTTKNYTEGLSHGLHTDIREEDTAYGHLWVYYAEERPFLIPEEQNLINSIADMLSTWIEQKKTEEEIQKSKELLEKSYASLDSAIFILDSKKPPIIIACNPAVTKIFGYEKREMIGRTTSFLHVSKLTLLKFQNVLYPAIEKQGYFSSFEFQMKRKNGQIFPSEHSVFPLLDDKGNRSGFVSVVKDITERKKAQNALQESKQRYYSLYEYSPIALWEEDFSEVKKYIDKLKKRGIKDFRKYLEKHPEIVRECVALVKVLDTNKATLDQYHAMNKEHIISDLRNIFTEETYKSFIEEIVAVAQGKTFIKFQSSARTLKYDKTDRIVRWVALPGYEDTYSKVLVSEIDITEQEHLMNELERSQKQLRNLSAYLESAREEERKSMAREIHDELGQSLTALKMDISWLNKRFSSKEKTLLKKIKSMTKLVDDTIQRVKKISSSLRPSIIDDLGLPAAIEWQLDEFQERTGITCSMHSEPEETIVGTNISINLFRILQEALTNTARHAKASKVRVSLKEETDKLIFMIQDNGIGITEEQIRDPKSLGLLGIQERVHFIGGSVRINGKPGRGTTVRVSVPLSK